MSTFEIATELELQSRTLEGIVWLQRQQDIADDQETKLLVSDLLGFTIEKHHEEVNRLVEKLYNKKGV